ncbi:hypothetical protein DERP_009279 [Dermatophagoides pteronyssinus]|uniref:Uncharacterized protein n=1 Tax=Dermatophagoides pteronyssinus TaxID=6956 RepID=A0ABQ8ITF9_DERPT|nr:hypothetical protein DERP_009279 [Dermatophagoides pteronyssinus]
MKKKKINKQETKTNGNTYKNVVNKPGYLKLKNKQNNNRQDRDCSKLCHASRLSITPFNNIFIGDGPNLANA